MPRLLIIGCGYVGRPVAQEWMARGGEALALTRGGQSADELAELGIPCHLHDWLRSGWQLPTQDFDAALVAVPHRPDESLGIETHVHGMTNLLAELPKLNRLVVLSTTGVYTQENNERVDEDSVTEPERPGPLMALRTEKWIEEHYALRQATILRLAGIYGPKRIPLLSKLQSGEPLAVPSAGCLNLVHIVDIKNVILQLLTTIPPSNRYVLSDGHPVERREFYREMARVFETPEPQFVEPAGESSRAARAESSKRVDPSRIVRELGLKLTYPDYRSGLPACR